MACPFPEVTWAGVAGTVRDRFEGPATKTPLAMDIRRVSKAVGPQLISLGLIIVSPARESVWNSRVVVRFSELDCCVVSRDGLITMKSIAGRLQDLADIERLRADQGEGDADNASET